jgi:uncharacterized protein with von Willebrand factor type A (vWA) domain
VTALPANIVHFARLLRRAGLPVGPAEVIAAGQALGQVDIGERTQVRAALRGLMVHRHEHLELFDRAFDLFWRDPNAAQQAMALALLDGTPPAEEQRPAPGSRRLAEALAPPRPQQRQQEDTPPELDAVMTVSERERLQSMDFEQMSAEQVGSAKAEIRRLRLPLDLRRTRRLRPEARGPRMDLAATLRRSLRRGGEIVDLSRSARTVRPPPLVVLCDISGSMARYAQVLLHFLHAVANDRDRVHVFLFGTRLSNITRQLRFRDPEVSFQMVSQAVPDWSGGTRIGEALAEFNRRWSRRVLAQGAVVLLVTDGLDRDGAAGLADEMDRLHRSCRRLIWLNPLLRWDGFQPKSGGIRAMLPYVDEFRTVHSLDSLRALVDLLSRPAPPRGAGVAWSTK